MQPNSRAQEPSCPGAHVKVQQGVHFKKWSWLHLLAQLHPLTLLIVNGGHGGEMDEEESVCVREVGWQCR